MTCPRCKCPECAKAELNAVLVKHVSRETIPAVDEINAVVLRDNQAREQWRDTVEQAR